MQSMWSDNSKVNTMMIDIYIKLGGLEVTFTYIVSFHAHNMLWNNEVEFNPYTVGENAKARKLELNLQGQKVILRNRIKTQVY